MSATETQPDSSYFLRKLHSFTGLLPVGAFLAEHFWSNSAALVSAKKYDDVSQELQTIPFRLIVEWGAIFLPMLFHGGYGVYIWWRGKSNVSAYPWVGNWLYTVCLHWMASLHGAVAHAWEVNVCKRRARRAKSVVPRIFCGGCASVFVSFGRRYLEFSLQVGPGRNGQGAAGRRTAWRAGGNYI